MNREEFMAAIKALGIDGRWRRETSVEHMHENRPYILRFRLATPVLAPIPGQPGRGAFDECCPITAVHYDRKRHGRRRGPRNPQAT